MADSDRPNLLFLTHRVPYPPDRGDRIRSYHILRQLSERYNVYLGALADEPVSHATIARLNELTVKQALVPIGRSSRWLKAAISLARGRSATEGLFSSQSLAWRVRTWARQVRFDAVVAFCSSMVQFAELPELIGVPLVVDLVDVDSQKWADYARATSGLKQVLFALESRRVRNLERSLPGRANAILLVSEAEAAIYRSFCPNDKTLALMNGVDRDYFSDRFHVEEIRPNQCCFVGVLDYRANVEGLKWFCREVWPGILGANPQAQFAIVGKNPTPAIIALGQRPGIRLVGPVADVRPYIAESRFVIAPLLIARGIQNKVLEAMSMGKPVLASPQALEGLAVTPDIHAIPATTPIEWADATNRLYTDDELCRTIGNNAIEYVTLHGKWESFDIISSLISTSSHVNGIHELATV